MKALSFDDIQLIPRYNNIPSRKHVSTQVTLGEFHLDIPVLSANMDTITGVKMANKMAFLGGLGVLHRFCSIDENIHMYNQSSRAVVSLGVNEGLDRFTSLYHKAGARTFCVDVAHGHCQVVGDMIRSIKNVAKDAYIIAGNVCTAEGAEYLATNGADAIKVGIGPGSACTTRIKTGFGIPQFTAIQECRQVNCFIIADGGIKTPGDAVKAFAAGADAIMLGGMLSGTDETPGEVIDGEYKIFRGMASKEAQDSYMGSMPEWKTSEGVEMVVKYKGSVESVIRDLMGGIRSGMTYCGANNLQEIRQRARWVEITSAGVAEAKPHGQGRL